MDTPWVGLWCESPLFNNMSRLLDSPENLKSINLLAVYITHGLVPIGITEKSLSEYGLEIDSQEEIGFDSLTGQPKIEIC